jgi:nitrite reductase (NADH) small subunit
MLDAGASGAGAARASAPDVDAGCAWVDVCALADILPDTGVCALVGGRQVAIFRAGAGADLYALQNFDPFGKAFVLSRGIVGDRGGIPKVASPLFKQSFDLRTGQCLDDPAIRIRAYRARLREGRVEVLVPIDVEDARGRDGA